MPFREQLGKTSPSTQRELGPANPVISDSQTENCEKVNVCYFSHQGVVLGTSSHRNRGHATTWMRLQYDRVILLIPFTGHSAGRTEDDDKGQPLCREGPIVPQ